ncbi:MAG: hypothetical protein KGI51_14635 [Rhodospirillales bacterium]|nr:hypothetical protein [Rhodospirillales bacterium]
MTETLPDRRAGVTPPLEFGNRAFIGLANPRGRAIVIDSPREFDASLVPIDIERDVLVHGAYMAEAVAVSLLRRGLRGVVGVDAGIGRNDAGIAGLAVADEHGVPAASISVYSAEMCDGRSVWTEGVISRVNHAAAALGAAPGQGVPAAVEHMLRGAPGQKREVASRLPEAPLRLAGDERGAIWGCWSMSLIRAPHPRDVFCVGTPVDTTMTVYMYRHGVRPAGVIGSDGGFGRAGMAVAGLGILERMGIPCAAVSHLSADLGDGASIYRDGRISAANRQAAAAGIVPGMTATEAAARLLRVAAGGAP